MHRPLIALLFTLGCGNAALITVGEPPDAGTPDAGPPPATCGDGKLDPGEECDWGGANAGGAGCEKSCRFSCSRSPDSCAQGGDVCQGASACTPVTSGSALGQKCAAGAPLAACAPCGGGRVCLGGRCTASACGDACLDVGRGEQCDDGNVHNLDGCDSACKVEQEQRISTMLLQFSTNGFCPNNAIGRSVGAQLQDAVQQGIHGGIGDGSITLAWQFLGLSDPTGAGNQSLRIGVLGGQPYSGPQYDGHRDLDWWYETDRSGVDGLRLPTELLDASLSGGQLNAGPGNVTLSSNGVAGVLEMSSVRLTAHLDAPGAPGIGQGATPGHLISEHIDPALAVISSTSGGELCSDVVASSLRRLQLPPEISQTNCSEGYSPANSVLDLFVRGCTSYGIVKMIAPTQPDRVNPAARPAGGGGPYRLYTGAGGIVNRCTDRLGATVDLATCLDAAAFSVFFKFGSGRVIMK